MAREQIAVSTSSGSGIARDIDLFTGLIHRESDVKDDIFSLVKDSFIDVDVNTEFNYGRTTVVDTIGSMAFNGGIVPKHLILELQHLPTVPVDEITLSFVNNDLKNTESSTVLGYFNILPRKDVDSLHLYTSVKLYSDKPIQESPEYIPSSDFSINMPIGDMVSDFNKPIDYNKLVTPLSPVDGVTESLWDKIETKDIEKHLTYGYSVNKFLVGGIIDAKYPVDEDAVDPDDGGTWKPPTTTPEGEVIIVVNIINIVALPNREAINFTDFSMSTDLNSMAWVINFTVADLNSLALIKPSGMNYKEIEVSINGEKFVFFIGRTSTSTSVDGSGRRTHDVKCVGWSNTKRLTYPYSPKRSHTETSSATPAQLVNDELTGTGFTGNWNSPSWTIPANVYSYFEKAPLAAIVELVNSIGSVVIPSPDSNSFDIKPYYPVSPWDWGGASIDHTLSESQFFTIDYNWLPQESPDSVYVYGEENGVAVKCVKAGTAGLVTLPTIVDKHITDTIAGTERGRIEVAKNGFKEVVPVTTYVGVEGIITPQSMVEINEIDGGTWRGMVIGTGITVKRNGNALVQSLQIERHYDN